MGIQLGQELGARPGQIVNENSSVGQNEQLGRDGLARNETGSRLRTAFMSRRFNLSSLICTPSQRAQRIHTRLRAPCREVRRAARRATPARIQRVNSLSLLATPPPATPPQAASSTRRGRA